MSTIEITYCIEYVRVGDLVTLEDRRDPSDDGNFEPDPEWRLTGHVRAIDVTHTTRDGKPYGWSVRIGHTSYMVGYLSPGGVMWAYSLVSATREVPEWEPGTVYEITTRDGDTGKAWCVRHTPDDTSTGFVDEDCTIWQAWELTSIKPVPDDAEAWGDAEMWRKDSDAWQGRYNESNRVVEALRAELAKAIQERDFWHQQYDDREEVTRTMRHGRRAQRERAEAAERERDEMQGDLQTQIQITRDVRAERDKALAEVERLRAARQVPTRKQLVDAMWPDAPEGARVQMTSIDMVDRVLALLTQTKEAG